MRLDLLSLTLEFILLLLLIPTGLLLLLNLFYYVYNDLKAKSADLYQYKITNFYFTFTIIGLYITFFIGIIYGLRIIYINKTLDLKVLYYKFYTLILQFTEMLLIFQVYYIFIFILLFLLLIFIVVNIQTLCYKEFFKLHIYLYVIEGQKDIFPFKYMYCQTLDSWGWYNSNTPEIISGYIKSFIIGLQLRSEKRYFTKITNIEKIYYYFFKKHYRSIRHSEKIIIKNMYKIVSHFINSKYYKWLFYLSPLFVILYDCYFNNWVLVHIFYYMIVYGPLIIIKRVTACTHSINGYIREFFKTFYYANNSEHIRYMKTCASKINKSYEIDTPHMVCIPKDFKIPMIDMYLLNGLRNDTHKFGVVAALDGSAFADQIYMLTNSYFLDSKTANMYISTGDVTLVKMEDNKLYRFIYEHKLGEFELGEEWIVLEDKYGIERPWTKVEYDKEEEINILEIWEIIRNRANEDDNKVK